MKGGYTARKTVRWHSDISGTESNARPDASPTMEPCSLAFSEGNCCRGRKESLQICAQSSQDRCTSDVSISRYSSSFVFRDLESHLCVDYSPHS